MHFFTKAKSAHSPVPVLHGRSDMQRHFDTIASTPDVELLLGLPVNMSHIDRSEPESDISCASPPSYDSIQPIDVPDDFFLSERSGKRIRSDHWQYLEFCKPICGDLQYLPS